jgi:hypothetical protein
VSNGPEDSIVIIETDTQTTVVYEDSETVVIESYDEDTVTTTEPETVVIFGLEQGPQGRPAETHISLRGGELRVQT